MDEETLRNLRGRLEADRAQQLRVIEGEGAVPEGKSVHNLAVSATGMADAAQNVEQRSEELAHIDHARDRLRQIDEALARMDAGTYGRCEVCGREISEERLQARPLAVRCVEDAEREVSVPPTSR